MAGTGILSVIAWFRQSSSHPNKTTQIAGSVTFEFPQLGSYQVKRIAPRVVLRTESVRKGGHALLLVYPECEHFAVRANYVLARGKNRLRNQLER
jgi:hypothetical protein